LGQGDAYLELRPAISICVLDRELFPGLAEFHLSFRLRCDQGDLVFSEDLVFHTLELPKYDAESDNAAALGSLEKWLYFLKRAEHLEAKQLAERLVGDAYREAVGVLEMISKTPEDRQFYESRVKFLHDEQARLIAAREEGRAEGREEGRAEGREEGTLAGKIQLLQQLLGDEEVSTSDLLQRTSLELNTLLLELQERLRSRGR
jgi:predicted transposase/invertase (TIGR01784 family)